MNTFAFCHLPFCLCRAFHLRLRFCRLLAKPLRVSSIRSPTIALFAIGLSVAWSSLVIAKEAPVRLPEISATPDAKAYPFEWGLDGYAMVDADHTYDEQEQYYLRRLSLEASAEQQHWTGEVQVRLEETPEIQDLNLTYSGLGGVALSVGRMKIPSGLEADVSSRHLVLIERSIATEQTALGRGNGIALAHDAKDFGFKVGVFDTSDWNDQVQESVLRLYTSPINRKRQQLHLGLHVAVRDWKKGRYRLRSQREVEALDDVRLTAALNPKKIHHAGIELAYQHAGWLAQLEYTQQDIQVFPNANQTNVQYQFVYYQVSWLPFGHYRRYRDGVFKRVSGKSSLTKWELVVRQSEVDAFDQNSGTLMQTTTLGVNWYCFDDIKLMLNHGTFEWEQPANNQTQSGESWSARLQWEFEL